MLRPEAYVRQQASRSFNRNSSAMATLNAEMYEALPKELLVPSTLMAELGITAEVADDLLGQFPPYLANAIAALRQAAADERWSGGDAANTSVMGVAHQVKGSALQLGALRLGKASESLQMLAKQGAGPQTTAALQIWLAVADETLGAMRNLPSISALMNAPILTSQQQPGAAGSAEVGGMPAST